MSRYPLRCLGSGERLGSRRIQVEPEKFTWVRAEQDGYGRVECFHCGRFLKPHTRPGGERHYPTHQKVRL